jgi:probable HAF family extracellular repeat protein
MRSNLFAFVAVLLSLSASAYAATLTPLGDLAGGMFESYAHGVSNDGAVVVGAGHSASGYEAFRWTSAGGMVGLGDLPGGVFTSTAFGVSGDGAVVVGFGTVSGSPQQAFRWTSAGGMVSLGGNVAHGVSGDGSVVVGYAGYEAFRWTSAGGMVGLGSPPGVIFYYSEANGVSGDGSVIVGRATTTTGYEAFRWASGGGMERLWDMLVAQGVDPAADGWTRLTYARDVSADGNAIVGYGIRNGNTEAFVAVVPVVSEPGDFNHDGVIDAGDYVVWRKNDGTPERYNTWRAHFGQTSSGGAAMSENVAPEPSSLGLLTLAAFILLRHSRRPHVSETSDLPAVSHARLRAISLVEP